jgi:hypothetical protein
MPVFVKGQNPAVSLFNFWDEFVPQSRSPYPCKWQKWGITDDDPGARMGWGDRGWAIGRITRGGETGFIYGKRYRGIYASFVLLPDGRFGLRYVHGYDNRVSLSKGTFLHYDQVAARERWSVDPSLRWKDWIRNDDLDRQGHVPKLLVQKFGFDLLWELKYDYRDRERISEGWRMVLAEDQHTDLRVVDTTDIDLSHARAWLESEERRRLKRIDYRENPRPKRPKRIYIEPDIPALASHIVALLRVDEPANNVPHPKARLQEAAHE